MQIPVTAVTVIINVLIIFFDLLFHLDFISLNGATKNSGLKTWQCKYILIDHKQNTSLVTT